MTENKPTEDFIKLSRREYQIILAMFIEQENLLSTEECTVRDKIQQILLNIQKFNANKRRQEISK